jgi:RNA polymerase sigma-70 factor, ECF subfamily
VSSFADGADGDRSDAELLAAHVAGDRHAFAVLLARHRGHLARLADLNSYSRDDAADALQDALFSAHRAAATFRHDASVSSWLHRIVVNSCRDRLRHNRSHPTVPLIDDERVAGDPIAPVDAALTVRRALLRLPDEQRAAIVAVDLHGYSVAEAARLLGVPEGTVKSRRARGRDHLARTLRPHPSREGQNPPGP